MKSRRCPCELQARRSGLHRARPLSRESGPHCSGAWPGPLDY
nr:MAG TPA: hypothetical protein [Caudoviricetes sp.]